MGALFRERERMEMEYQMPDVEFQASALAFDTHAPWCRTNRPDSVLNGFLSVGFQTDQKFSGKYGECNGMLGLAASHVFCPLSGCFVLSTYNIWHYMAASEMCGACGPKYAAMGRVFVGLCLMYKLLLSSGCFGS